MPTNEIIRTVRESKGLTQKELGEMLCVSENDIIDIESGKLAPSDTLLKLMSVLFNLDFEELKNNSIITVHPNLPNMDGIITFYPSEQTPERMDLYYVFAPELDDNLFLDIVTEGGFVNSFYNSYTHSWIYEKNHGKYHVDITKYVKAWTSYENLIHMLPADVLRWYVLKRLDSLDNLAI